VSSVHIQLRQSVISKIHLCFTGLKERGQCQKHTYRPWNIKNIVIFEVLTAVRRLLVTANVPSLPILVTLMMEALSSSETSVLTRATWRNIKKTPFVIKNIEECWKWGMETQQKS
jgi:hypothetical protein